MREADMHYEAQLNIDFEDATQNLCENLHLKWNYGLLFVDKYTDEHGSPISVISGLRKDDDVTVYIRVHLIQENKSAHAKFDLWEVNTSGWPFPKGVGSIGASKTNKLIDLVDDMREFCITPYQETRGVMPSIRSMFSGNSEIRKYKQD
ncbi:MAG: hypothetical protein AAFV93_13040 [Chloroflexota bacterium]